MDPAAVETADELPPPPSRPAPAIPGYDLLGEIGRGGMGVVYQARHRRLGRAVALKLLRAGALAGAADRERFLREARAGAALQHPHIVQVFDVGEHGGCPFLALEYVGGGSLARRLADGPLSPPDAARLTVALAGAVQYAHDHGVVHRDLRPANVLLLAGDDPKVADFGLARVLADDPGTTASGAIVGTPSYMAPEQAGGAKAVGPAVDVYALGAILYECLTDRPPFRAATVVDTLDQVRSVEPVPPARLQPAVPRDLNTVCLKCLEKDPARRYATAAAGRRPAAVPGRRAGPGPAGRGGRPQVAVVPPQPAGGRAARGPRPGPGRGVRRCVRPVAAGRGAVHAGRGPAGDGRRRPRHRPGEPAAVRTGGE